MYCHNPFTVLSVGDLVHRTCCSAWLNKEVWAPNVDDPWEIWNHINLQKLRKQMLDHQFNYCLNCPNYLNGIEHVKEDWHKPILECGPRQLSFSVDTSCNLCCWTCRDHFKMDKSNLEERQNRIIRFIDVFKKDLCRMKFTNMGDPFASPVYLPVLQNLDGSQIPRTRITLFTNALLLPRYWDSLKKIHDNIHYITISIDAATKETYEKMRVGGKWEELQAALSFVEKLDHLQKVIYKFTICKSNFEEMPSFLRMAEKRGAVAQFAPLRRWKHIPLEQFVFENVSSKTHEDHGKLLSILKTIGSSHCFSGQLEPHVMKCYEIKDMPSD